MKEKILDFLKSQHIATLATINQDLKPHAAVILYTLDDDMNFYFATHQGSEKIQNMNKNNTVSLTVWANKALSVQVEGEGEEVINKNDRSYILEKLANAAANEENFYPPIFRINGQVYAIYKIKPTRCRYLDLKEEHINEFKPILHELKL